MPRVHEPVQANRHRGLEADDAERGAVELDELLVGVVRLVVAGHAVDSAVGEGGEQGLDVGGAAQGRVRLAVRVVAGQPLVGQGQVMRGDLAGDRDPARLPRPHRPQRTAGADVGEMNRPSRERAQGHVAPGHDLLGRRRHAAQPQQRRRRALVGDPAVGEGGVLAVVDDRHAAHGGVLEGAPHQDRVGHGAPRVGDGNASGVAQLADGREPPPRPPLGHRPDRVDPREARLGRLREDEAGHAGLVVRGLGVGQAGDRGEAAGNGRRDPRGDRLLVLGPGLAQVDVHVDEARTHHAAWRDVHDRGPRLDRQIAADPRHPAAPDQHVGGAVDAGDGVDDAPPLQNGGPLTHRRAPPGGFRPAGTAPPCGPRPRWRPARE